MIRYNLRYRGPFEYDKLIISILQLANEIKYSTRQAESNEYNILNGSDDRLRNMFEELTGERGLLNSFLKLKLKVED